MNKILGPNYEGDHVKYLGKLYFKILLNISIYFRFKEELIFNSIPSHTNVSTYFFFSDSK